MRRGELFELRWKHVSLERRTAHLRATKNGFPRTPPLTPKAAELLLLLSRSLYGRVSISVQGFPGNSVEKFPAAQVLFTACLRCLKRNQSLSVSGMSQW